MQERTYLGRLGVEQFRQVLDVVALTDQLRFGRVDVLGKHGFNDIGFHGLLADVVTLIKGQSQVLFDLKRQGQLFRERGQSIVSDDFRPLDAFL